MSLIIYRLSFSQEFVNSDTTTQYPTCYKEKMLMKMSNTGSHFKILHKRTDSKTDLHTNFNTKTTNNVEKCIPNSIKKIDVNYLSYHSNSVTIINTS
jgi:hypothetical protein